MAKLELSVSRIIGGIADYPKESPVPNSVAWMRSIDYRSNPRAATILPGTVKESGTVVVDFPKWMEVVGDKTYAYGDAGNLYERSSAGSWTNPHLVSESHGNGMAYYPDDRSLYYTSDVGLGRFGSFNGVDVYKDNYLQDLGGVPNNTHSLRLVAASSQYAYRADTASLSLTGDLTAEAYIYPETLPAVGSSMTIMSKWNANGNLRSYMYDIYGVSAYFGDGSDGALTISANTTDAPIDSACTGTSGSYSLTATNASFATGQIIMIHQSQYTGAGTWMRNKIGGYTAGTITLETALNATYTTGAQVLVIKQYTNVTINSGYTLTAKAWNGTVGGILGFVANGTVSGAGTISANGCGFRGGSQYQCTTNTDTAYTGESHLGASYRKNSFDTSGYGNAGGGGARGATGYSDGAGGGGSNGSSGTSGGGDSPRGGGPGSTYGTTDLTTIAFGGSGGGGVFDNTGGTGFGGNGGNGGGIVFITAAITTSIAITSTGANGQNWSGTAGNTGGGGGAGGSILLKSQVSTLGTTIVTASGGSGGSSRGGYYGGSGGSGRIHLDYYTSYTGTTTPTLDATQDNNLVTTTTYQYRLHISSNGTLDEILTMPITNLGTGAWTRAAVSWDASTSTSTFYENGVSLGTRTGSATSISNNASEFFVGSYKDGAGTATGFFDGYIDDVRLWNLLRSDSDLYVYKDVQLIGTEGGLATYYKLNNAVTDSTANANTLTLSGSPTYSTTVLPFLDSSVRLDLDQTQSLTGQTYTVPTTISETAANLASFVPEYDPQHFIGVKIATKGTGNWTITVHDKSNNTITTATALNADLPSAAAFYDFHLSSTWRPVVGNTYHFHLTSTVADGTVTTGTTADLSTVSFNTYYQFLVTKADYHPIKRFLNFIVIGNERYVAKWDNITYEPNRLVIPSEYFVRCFANFREYLAIGCMRGTNVYDYEEGKIFFWDGVSDQYNFSIDVPEGAINSMLGSKDVLNIIAGYQGDIMVYNGGGAAQKIKRLPKIAKDKYIEVIPGSMTMYQALLRIGVAGASDSSVVEKGVYTWGSLNTNYPDSLSYDYPIATGSRLDTVKIGAICPVNKKLLIGYQDNTSYGIDVVDPSNQPYRSATLEYMIEDVQRVYKDKTAMIVKGTFLPLVSGEGVNLKYKINQSSTWNESGTYSTVGKSENKIQVANGRFNEIQLGIDLLTTTTTSPTLLDATVQLEDNKDEQQI